MFLSRFKALEKAVSTCAYSLEKGEINGVKALEIFHFLLKQIVSQQGIVYVIGNGGSAGIASHFCTDLIRTLGIASETLYDPNVLTCISNDFGYHEVFSRQLSLKMRSNDLLVAISSSGNSQNILSAVKAAKEKKGVVVTLSGFDSENPLRKAGDLNFWIDSRDYGLVETSHFFLLHTVIDAWRLEKEKSEMEPCLKK